MTVTLHGIDGYTAECPVTWYLAADGRPCLRVRNAIDGWHWDLAALRVLAPGAELGLPGGGYLTGLPAAVEAYDRGELPRLVQ